MKKFRIFSSVFLISIYMMVFTLPARASACSLTPGGSITFLKFPTWYQYLQGEDIAGKCTPIVNAESDILPIVVAIVEILLRIIGLAAVVYVVYGGFKYVTSQGQPDATAQARHTIQNALIGLVISMIASLAVSFIGRSIT